MIEDVRSIWPDYRPTPLVSYPCLAERCGVASIVAKLENERPLGNFKSLGGLYAGLCAISNSVGCASISELLEETPENLPALICASDGNHGLAVAAAAERVDAGARIYLHEAVPSSRATRIEALGAKVVWVEGTYDDAVRAAARDCKDGMLLVPDTTDELYEPNVAKVMQGYGLIAAEIREQTEKDDLAKPSHLFVQAGVGGLAAAMAEELKSWMRNPGHVVVVEPECAACVEAALASGEPIELSGSLETSAEMLACGLASRPALRTLVECEAISLAVSEDSLNAAPELLKEVGGPSSTPSGAAGLAGLLELCDDPKRKRLYDLCEGSDVLLLVTEGKD